MESIHIVLQIWRAFVFDFATVLTMWAEIFVFLLQLVNLLEFIILTKVLLFALYSAIPCCNLLNIFAIGGIFLDFLVDTPAYVVL